MYLEIGNMKTYIYILLGAMGLTLVGEAMARETPHVREYHMNQSVEDAAYRFTFVHMSDTHIGEGEGDYGSPGFEQDTMPEGDVGYAAISLRRSVNWINNHAEDKGIKFVVITGDITDSGERSEFEKAKEILDDLVIPYVPIIGNHDIWPYVSYQNEAEYGYGTSVMNEVFEDAYERAKDFFDYWDDGYRLKMTYNPKSGEYHNFHNFSFGYDGVGFIAVDLNPRHHVEKEEPGVGGYAVLNNFEDGSYPWLLSQVQEHPMRAINNLVILSHQPPHRDFLSWYNGLPLEDVDLLTRDLLPYREHLGVWLAGHVHRNRNYALATIGGGMKVMDMKETPANKDYSGGYLSLIHAYTPTSTPTSISEKSWSNAVMIYPNPVSQNMQVHTGDDIRLSSYKIYSADGQEIQSERIANASNNLTIDVSGLKSGAYMLQLKSTTGQYATKSFIKLD